MCGWMDVSRAESLQLRFILHSKKTQNELKAYEFFMLR